MLELIVAAVFTFPLLWLICEFQEYRWLRIIFGVLAIATSYLVAYGVGSLQMLNANAWYGEASKELIHAVAIEIEEGETDRLLQELKWLEAEFEPTYENRAAYDELVGEFRRRLKHVPASD